MNGSPRARIAGIVLAGALAGCATAGKTAPPAPSSTPAPAPALSAALRWFRASAEYRASSLQTYAAATRRIDEVAAGRAERTWAVVLDADETVLDNSQFQKELELSGRRYSEEAWQAWVRRREAKLIPGARRFLERVRALGGVLAIVTNRAEAVCEDTRANFRGQSLPFDVILCKPDRGSSDKNPRFEAVAGGTADSELPPLEVLAYVGDNIRDFPGLDQPVRLLPDEAFAEFGTRFFVLPNPLYGSWERNPEP